MHTNVYLVVECPHENISEDLLHAVDGVGEHIRVPLGCCVRDVWTYTRTASCAGFNVTVIGNRIHERHAVKALINLAPKYSHGWFRLM